MELEIRVLPDHEGDGTLIAWRIKDTDGGWRLICAEDDGIGGGTPASEDEVRGEDWVEYYPDHSGGLHMLRWGGRHDWNLWHPGWCESAMGDECEVYRSIRDGGWAATVPPHPGTYHAEMDEKGRYVSVREVQD